MDPPSFKLFFQRPLTLDLKSVFSAQGLWFRDYFDYLDSQTLLSLEIFNDLSVSFHLDFEIRVNIKVKVNYNLMFYLISHHYIQFSRKKPEETHFDLELTP